MAQFFKPKAKKNTLKSSQLTVTSLNHEGVGVTRVDNKVSFITGGLPGEVVVAKQTALRNRYDNYQVEKILKSSPYRVQPPCQHYGQCGGCQLQHLDENQQLVEKQLAVTQLFKKFAGEHDLPWQMPLNANAQFYRRSARIAVFYDRNKKKFKLGYRQKGSKKIMDIDRCLVINHAFETVFSEFRNQLPRLKKGAAISHIQLCSTESGHYVILRCVSSLPQSDQKVLQALCRANNWILVFDLGDNKFESGCEMQTNDPSYRLSDYNLTLSFKFNNFIQINKEINQLMLTQASDWLQLDSNTSVLDLFCGVGNFSLPLALNCQSVVGVEGVPLAIEMAKKNAIDNKIDNVSFYCQDLTQNMTKESWFALDYDVLLLDPSRMGAEQILSQLKLARFKKILYVSCDPVTMARDSKCIIDAGFEIAKLGLMNMFPHTAHIETMALFERSK